MKPFNRREMCAGLTLLTIGGLTGVKMTEAETSLTTEGALSHSRVLRFIDVPASLLPNGTDRRVLAQSALATGEAVRVHESIAPPAAAAPNMHAIQHSELIVVVQGTVGMEHDGKVETGGPGDVLYVAFGTNHRIRNMGDGPARYVVISIGGDVKK
jgi:mannose-6-phosphate isomerase-like protein (cupin superfamily)